MARQKLLRRSVALIIVNYRKGYAAEDRQKTIEGVNDGLINHMITQIFSLKDTKSAHKAVESGKIIGNIVVQID